MEGLVTWGVGGAGALNRMKTTMQARIGERSGGAGHADTAEKIGAKPDDNGRRER